MANGTLIPEQQGPPQEAMGPPQEGGMPPQQEQPQGPQELSGMFPSNKDEADALMTMALRTVHQPDLSRQLIHGITQSETLEGGISKAVGMILAKLAIMIRQKANKDVSIKFLQKVALVIMREIYKILLISGHNKQKPTNEMQKKIVQEAIAFLMQLLQGEQQQMQEQGQEQGPPQEQMQQQPPQEPSMIPQEQQPPMQ